jgi:hypothetical protein
MSSLPLAKIGMRHLKCGSAIGAIVVLITAAATPHSVSADERMAMSN